MKILPEGWTYAQMEDISMYIQRGKSPKYVEKSGLPIINQKCIRWNEIQEEHLKFVDPEQWDKWVEERFLISGDILWNSTGTGTIGRAAIYKGLITSDQAVVDSHVTIVRSHADVSSKYLHYFIQSSEMQSKIKNMQSGSTNQVELSKKSIAEAKIPIAPSAEQIKIADKIDELITRSHKAKEVLSSTPDLLKKYGKSMLSLAFRGELSRSWRDDNVDIFQAENALKSVRKERSEQTQKYRPFNSQITSKLIDLPEGWVWAKLPELGVLERGKSRHRPRNDPKLFGGKYPFIQTGEVSNAERIIKDYTKTYSDFGLSQSKLWPKDTLCITIAANIAETAVLKIDACFPDSVVGLIADNTLTSTDYLEFFIRTLKDDLEAYAPATAQKNINLGTLYEVHVPLPPINEQKHILAKLHEAFNKISSLENIQNQLIEDIALLNSSILNKAFSGELVEHDSNDESAIELLKRIGIDKIALEKSNSLIKKEIKTKGAGRVKKDIISVITVLEGNSNSLTSQDLLEKAGYPNNASTSQVEAFFLDVRDAVRANKITCKRIGTDDVFELVR